MSTGNVSSGLLAAFRSRIADERPSVTAFTLSATGACKSAIVDVSNGQFTVTVEGGAGVDRIMWNLSGPRYNTVGRLLSELQRARGYTVVPDTSYISDHPTSDLHLEGVPDISNSGSCTLRHRLYSDEQLTRFLMDAVTLHNPNYANITNVPKTEHAYVLLKAAAIAYRALAADTVRRSKLGADANTLLALAHDLESQYRTDSERLHRIIPSPKADESKMGTGDIVSGRFTRMSLRTGAKGHLRDATPPTPANLYDAADDDVEDVNVRLRWSQARDEHHSHYEVWRDTQPKVERSLAGRLQADSLPQLPPQNQYSRATTCKQVLGSLMNTTPVFDGFFFWTAAEAQSGSLINATFIDGKIPNNVGVQNSVALGEPLEPETDYYYRVYVVTRNGEIAGSEVRHVRTRPMRARFKRDNPAQLSSDALSIYAAPLAGGTSLTVNGTNFITGTKVQINGKECGSIVIVSPTVITCTTPGFTNTDWVGRGLNVSLISPSGLVDFVQGLWFFT